MNPSVKIEGMEALQMNFSKIPYELRKKGNQRAVRKGGQVVAKAYRKKVKGPTKRQRAKAEEKKRPVRSGLLSKSVAVKVRTVKLKAVAYAVVGPKTATSGAYYGRKHVPAHIAHLVEGGHGGPAPAFPTHQMREAYDETKREVAKVIYDQIALELQKATRGV